MEWIWANQKGHMMLIRISHRRTAMIASDAPPHTFPLMPQVFIVSGWCIADISLCSSHTPGTHSCLMTAARLQLHFPSTQPIHLSLSIPNCFLFYFRIPRGSRLPVLGGSFDVLLKRQQCCLNVTLPWVCSRSVVSPTTHHGARQLLSQQD